MIFVKRVPPAFVDRVVDATERVAHHVRQVPTKRGAAMRRCGNRCRPDTPVAGHAWLGVPAEGRARAARITRLRQTGATAGLVSFDPPGSIGGVSWATVGGESGPKARATAPGRARELRGPCLSRDVAFFFKQRGGFRPKSGGRSLDDGTSSPPTGLRPRGRRAYNAALRGRRGAGGIDA